MPQSLASRSDSLALAAAMSRHPAARARGTLPTPGGTASFATVAALLTGPWRVNDPVGFDAAMRVAPLVAGYPVVDLAACARQPTAGLDPLSASVAGHLESAVGAAALRGGLAVRWVAARIGPDLLVESAARAAADTEGPELLVLAHLVEPVGPGSAGPAHPMAVDSSWIVVVVGDERGGVAGIVRAMPAPQPARDPGRLPTRLGLTALRARLAGPARAEQGVAGPGRCVPSDAVVLPFRR